VQGICCIPEVTNKHSHGFRAISTGNNGKVSLWTLDPSLPEDEAIQFEEYSAHTGWINDAQLFPSADKIFTCSHDGRAVVWDLPESHMGAVLDLFIDPEPFWDNKNPKSGQKEEDLKRKIAEETKVNLDQKISKEVENEAKRSETVEF